MASHTNSTTWSSPAALAAQRFARLQNAAQHLDLARSPFFPRSAAEYAAHKAGWAGDVAERERRRLVVRMREVEGRRRMVGKGEGVGGLGAGGVDGEGFAGLLIEEGQGGARGFGGEGGRGAGKAWVGGLGEDGDGDGDGKGVTASENGEVDDSSSEQVNSPATENASKEGSSNGKTKRKNHRGNRGRRKRKGSKGKNKSENVKHTIESPESVESKEGIKLATPTTRPATRSRARVGSRASLLSRMTNDPLVQASKAIIPKDQTSDPWPLFQLSPLNNTPGGGAGTNALFASLQRPGYTPVLGAATCVWAGDEHLKPEGRRDPFTNDHHAAWPEMGELKAEGQYRKGAGKERRLPIPRMDMMNREAVIRAAGGQENVDEMSQEEIDDVCRELAKLTGDQIPWMDRQPIRFDGIDRLECADRQWREENERRRNGEPISGPQHHSGAYGAYASHAAQGISGEHQRPRRRTNSRLRGGYNDPGTPRRQVGCLPPIQQQPISPEAFSYGADGLGDGMAPPPGAWVFDEDYLESKGDWQDLLADHL